MPDEWIRTLPLGVIATLFAFELLVAIKSWVEAREPAPHGGAPPLLISRPVTIRDHFAAHRNQVHALRRRYPSLRSRHHGYELRNAIRACIRGGGPPMR